MASVSNAPDPNRIRLSIDTDIGLLPSVRVNCGPWPATLTWREPDMRVLSSTNDQSTCLTIRKANNEAKRFSRQLALENVTQAAARNALCEGLLRLKRQYGHADILHVHDEVLLLVPRRRDAVLAARAALLGTFGPGHQHALGWAVLMKPDEISVTATLWEDENDIALPKFDPKNGLITGNDRWGKIERNEPGCLDGLP